MSKSVVVFGGAGFLGKRICQAFFNSGYNVTSISRSGTPPAIESHHDAFWIKNTNWAKGDVFNPPTYAHHLKNTNAVVHSIGVLFENSSYKKLLHAKRDASASVLGTLCENRKAVSAMFGGANPMEKSATNSYEAMNYQSAITLAETLAESKTESIAGETAAKPVFIYVSADQQVPMVPVGYIQTKRKAEAELFSRFGDSLRSIVLRPGIMCDEQTAFDFRHAVKGAVDLAGSIGSVTGTSAFVNSIARPVVSTQKVAEVAVKKTEDASFYGIVGLNELVKE